MDDFHLDLRREKYNGSYDLAYKTINHLRKLITQTRWANANDLMAVIKQEGRKMVATQPSEFVIGNMVRRVLKIVREEYVQLKGESEDSVNKESLHNMVTTGQDSKDYSTPFKELQTTVMEALNEYIDEMEASIHNISAQAVEHIHSDEVILTVGKSRTVEAFLKQAAKKRKFHVIVVEGAPLFHGHDLAKSLASKGIEVTVVTDSAVFAMMSRVNKVIIGTHSVLANGGLKAVNGGRMVALAASQHAVPVIVLGAMFKLCHIHHSAIEGSDASFNRLVSPQDAMDYSEGGLETLTDVQYYCPTFDYVPPELVTLFISNIGGNAPSYMYRLLSELYHPDDYEI